jgi:hypothetical protein
MPDLNTTVNNTIQAIINHTAPVQLSVTPAPTPIPAGIATTALDWAPIPIEPFNIPLWAILAFLSFAALVIVFFHWNDKSADLNAIKPWFIKIKELALGKIQVIRLSRAGTFIPDCLDIFDNVISYGDSEQNISMWRLNSPQGMIKVGGVSAAILSEDWNQNRDIVTECAIMHASDTLEQQFEELKIKLNKRYQELVGDGLYPPNAENPANLIRPIQNGLDYIGKSREKEDAKVNFEISGRRLLQLLFPEGIAINAYINFNQNKFRKFWYKGSSAALYGGTNIRRVEDELVKHNEKEAGFFQKYGAMLIAAMVFLGCMIAGAVIPLG